MSGLHEHAMHGCESLGPLVSPDDEQPFWEDAFNPEDLVPFTNTLFYDIDLERFLDPAALDGLLDGEACPTSYETDSRLGLGLELDGFETGDTTSLSHLGFDFLDFKIPVVDHQNQNQQPSNSPIQQAPPITSTKDIPDREAPRSAPVAPTSTVAHSHPPLAAAQPPATSIRRASTMQQQDLSPTSPLSHGYPNGEQSLGTLQPRGSASSSSPPQPYDPANYAHLSPQEQARLAAEEDKRRRNTAASARFRIKKKQRDQALERQAKETAERVQELEKKISQLELENRWLRNLLVEKNAKKLEESEGRGRTDGTDATSSTTSATVAAVLAQRG